MQSFFDPVLCSFGRCWYYRSGCARLESSGNVQGAGWLSVGLPRVNFEVFLDGVRAVVASLVLTMLLSTRRALDDRALASWE